jgi:hypothetical protein
MPKKRRSAPEPVDPVSIDGTTYEVIHFGKARGLKQNGGYIAKIDQETGEELEVIRVYKVRYRWWRAIEKDKHDIFITSMSLDESGKKLMISHERGGEFALDLETGAVETL